MILSDDGVEIYRKKGDSTPKAMIPLKGAKLSSTCPDFLKRTVRSFCKPPSHAFTFTHFGPFLLSEQDYKLCNLTIFLKNVS